MFGTRESDFGLPVIRSLQSVIDLVVVLIVVAVDAVRVDLEEDGDAVAEASSYLGCRYAGVEPERARVMTRSLADVLNEADALLLDFDGPICGVYASLHDYVAADRVRAALAEVGER